MRKPLLFVVSLLEGGMESEAMAVRMKRGEEGPRDTGEVIPAGLGIWLNVGCADGAPVWHSVDSRMEVFETILFYFFVISPLPLTSSPSISSSLLCLGPKSLCQDLSCLHPSHVLLSAVTPLPACAPFAWLTHSNSIYKTLNDQSTI